jgi:hypothetical protein
VQASALHRAQIIWAEESDVVGSDLDAEFKQPRPDLAECLTMRSNIQIFKERYSYWCRERKITRQRCI